ncbi:MAG: hypothetical protein Q9165_004760 [Trypethelium subeluteriae]
MSYTKTANLEFLNRIGASSDDQSSKDDKHADDGVSEEVETKKTVGVEEMVLVYPTSVPGTQDEIRAEFINTMLRSKSKAQRDAIIATGLLPISAAIDILATVVWPFGGLLEIDGVWLEHGKDEELKLSFTPSPRLDVLERYLGSRCHERDAKRFASPGVPPTETDALEAIGWSPSQQTGSNWEDEQWEVTEVKDDMKSVMSKGAREYDKWCKAFEKKPEQALKK